MMEEVQLLWFLSISMLICSFLSGLVPMALKLSDSKSRLLALLGSGILVGTALSIIIPEGVDSLYKNQREPVTRQKFAGNNLHKTYVVNESDANFEDKDQHAKLQAAAKPQFTDLSTQSTLQNADPKMTWTIGISLIVGFVLMLLIEQFSIYQSGGSGHHSNHSHSSEIYTNPLQVEYTIACQDDDTDIGLEEDGEDKTILFDKAMTNSESKPIRDSDSHNILMMRSSTNESNIITNNNTGTSKLQTNSNPNRYYDHSKHFVNQRFKNTKVTPTLGLVIHAAADGIALGAAATTSHRDVEMIIFLAIMLHKAPAAFSLVVLLLHNGLRPSTIRKHLLAFSLSAPIAAVITFYGLSQNGKEALRRNNATGVAMLFSAGTFLFVATVHVLPELIQNKLLTLKEMLFLLGGAFLPLLLAQAI